MNARKYDIYEIVDTWHYHIIDIKGQIVFKYNDIPL